LLERQAALKLPDDFFATLLEQGRHVILLLDGLDEVPNEDERALVAQAVHDLTAGRGQTRFVVTSRAPAFQGRARDRLGDDFRVVRVPPIAPEQVADLIRRAYQAIYPAEVETDERNRRADGLIADVEKLETERAERLGGDGENRLVTTPLLVRMLLIVHFNLRRLPDQRAELYMEVVDTLLTSSHNPDEAVAQKLAQLGGDWRGRRDLCQYLAFQMHSRGRAAGREIAERELSDLLCAYLTERRRKPPEAAALLVEDFIATSRQRGGLLEELAGRHRFTHLSFQEFLTARYLAEGEREVARIARFIEDARRPADPWWREPILLTVGYLNITAPDTAGDLVRRLACLDDADCPHTPRLLATTELAATAFLPDKAGGAFDLPNHPVVMVRWYEAVAFCRWLSAQLGCTITLPTEAQWEKAASWGEGDKETRKQGDEGRKRRYPWGEEITADHANYKETGIGTTTAVGSFPQGASPCGALDMAGNVWEWCLTKGRDNCQTAADEAPEGEAVRVVRGGAYYSDRTYVRCAYRSRSFPDYGGAPFGFRVARSSP